MSRKLKPKQKIVGTVLVWLVLAPSTFAVESIGPTDTHKRETSAAGDFSLKPVRLYSDRGRRDPFVVASFDSAYRRSGDISKASKPELNEITISRLELTGFSEANGQKWALFVEKDSRYTYVLKSGKFFTTNNKRIKQVWGRIYPSGEVVLRQGERKLVYKNFRKDRRDR